MQTPIEPVIPAGDELSEQEATRAVLMYLPTCAYGEASFDQMKFDLPNKYIKLLPMHRERQRHRDEQMWVMALRNIGAHDTVPGNAIHDGILVKRRGGGYQLASRVRKTG